MSIRDRLRALWTRTPATPQDYGGGLVQLPLAPLPTPEQLQRWAEAQWDRWHVRHPYADAECPFCAQRKTAALAEHMSERHPDAVARRRWRHHMAREKLRLAWLSGCECPRLVTPEDARAYAREKLGQYFP